MTIKSVRNMLQRLVLRLLPAPGRTVGMTAMKEIIPGKELPLSFLSNGFSYNVEGDREMSGNVPFFRTQNGVCVIRWHLGMADRIRLAITGDIWHSTPIAIRGTLQQVRLHSSCPLDVSELGGKVSGLETRVMMSTNQMIDEAFQDFGGDKIANAVTVAHRDGGYMVLGNAGLGRFTTENGAIRAAGIQAKYETQIKRVAERERRKDAARERDGRTPR